MSATRQVVHRVEDGMDRQGVEATTYQMRNFYSQMRDGFFSSLDVFNYVQHHQVARWCKTGWHVLDVCCGRGLMLPLLRYHASGIASYTGVDIEPRNASWQSKRVTDGKPVEPDYYPFDTFFVHANAAGMASHLPETHYDMVIYTSSIEHMHPDAGQASLEQCRRVVAPGGQMVLTCPNTPEDQDGYDTRYRAHVYEWKRSELLAGLDAAGWRVEREWGLVMGVRELEAAMTDAGLGDVLGTLRRAVPSEWLVPVLAPLFPEQASEIALLCRPVEGLF